jgi:hypothetical protein
MIARSFTALTCSLVAFAPLAHAATFTIELDTTLSASTGPVFGAVGSLPVHLEFELDTDAGVVVVPSGTGSWNGPTLYGYQRAATTLSSFSVGNTSFAPSNLIARVPAAGYTADIWFDAPLEVGATPHVWMYLSNSAGTFQFGGAGCGFTCSFYDTAYATDYSLFTSATGPLLVTVSGTGPALEVEYAVPGESTMLKVSGAPPDRQVYFVTSAAQGSTFCPSRLGGQCLGVWSPVVLGQATTNARGDAWLVATVPSSYTPGTVSYFQAALPADAATLISDVVPVAVEAE